MMPVFSKGDIVEVCSKEEGFFGSYYKAKVLSPLKNNTRYKVQYKNLVEEEDESQPLVEIVSADEVRPVPPRKAVAARGFRYNDRVDAFDNDGWWVGTITGKEGTKYLVYFETTGEELAYDGYRLRNHFEWRNRNWIYSKNRVIG